MLVKNARGLIRGRIQIIKEETQKNHHQKILKTWQSTLKTRVVSKEYLKTN
jgi:hypothetical protein